MDSMELLLTWTNQNPFTAVSIFFGGSLLLVTLYTFFHDYRMLRGDPGTNLPIGTSERGQ
jgi:hypothetical protein